MTDPRLKIDINFLDQEWIGYPSLVQEVCDEAAVAASMRDTAKESLEVTDAELDRIHRQEKSSNKKLTEAIIEGAVKTDSRHTHAFAAYNDARLAAALAASLEKAVLAKGKALEALSRMQANAFFASDSFKEQPGYQNSKYGELRAKLAEKRDKR